MEETLEALDKCYHHGAEENDLQLLCGQPGAGLTTLTRQVAFAAAQAGFPTLVARFEATRP